jgi:hypothetical protein
MPLNVNIFLKEFAGCAVASLIDFFSGYDHVELDFKCKDIIVFMIPLGFLKQTTILQGVTNSIAQFVRIVTKILEKHIPHVYLPFINNIDVKDLKTTYNNEEVIPRIRRYILEHIIWIDGVLADLERAGCTILGAKSQFCMPGFRVVGFVCDALERYFNTFKVIKIVEWPLPNDIAEAKAFIRVAIYYRVFVKNFAVIAASIYFLMRKGIRFAWDTE